MLRFSRANSISKKLILLVSAVSMAAVFVALLVSTLSDIVSTRESAKSQMHMLADVLARNSRSAILFQDKNTAVETLSAIKDHNIVYRVEIVRNGNEVFASYDNPRPLLLQSWMHRFPSIDLLSVQTYISQEDKSQGMIRVYADLDEAWADLMHKWLVNLLFLGITLLIGFAVLRHLVFKLLQPVGSLAKVVREIIDDKRYALRVEKVSDDELGELTDEFNQMLAQIEVRDSQLRQNFEALAQTQDAITLRDENLTIQYVNPAFTVMFGYYLEDIQGKELCLIPDGLPEPQLSQAEVYRIAREDGFYRGEGYRQAKNGRIIPVSLQISPVKDEKGNLTSYVTVISDITEKKQAEEWIWRQANFDTLTGLPNRHMFHERLEQEILRTNRTNIPFALMFLDLDHFKEVNDTLGHDMGDELLKETAERLLSCVRNTDSVGYVNAVSRLGGDEFTIILNDLKVPNDVEKVAQRILDRLAEPYYLRGEMVYISVSIGITLYPKDASDAETLIKNADQTMYHAKSKGRNNFSYFTRSMQIAAQKRRAMINDLHNAIEQQQFQVVYQPIIDLATQQIHKAEALIRWQHPQRGIISPAEFIPVAEETGMIVEIGDIVFHMAIQQVAHWRESIHSDFQISINKSPVQFLSKSSKCLDWFEHMKRLGLPGECLAIEITEGLMLDQNRMVTDKLLAFRDAGVQVAVDDFGTGYSSLSYLKKFDIDFIKIDKSFVQNLSIYSGDMVLCEAIIVMAHKMGLKVVAEGIETVEQRDLLFGIGCDYGQGYFFSRPLPAEEFEKFVGIQEDLFKDVSLSHGYASDAGYS